MCILAAQSQNRAMQNRAMGNIVASSHETYKTIVYIICHI